MKRFVLMIIPAMICGMVFNSCSTKIDDESQTDINYPTTIHRLSEETLMRMRNDYAQRNPYLLYTLNQFGFCAIDAEGVSALATPAGSFTEEEAILAVKEFVARNPEFTGVTNPDDLHFGRITSSTSFNNVYWHFWVEQKEINHIEIYKTGIVFHIMNRGVYLCWGYHFPNVYVPEKFNFAVERAKSKLLGKEVVHLGWAGQYSLGKVKVEHLQGATTNLIIVPLITEEKIELRVTWKIYLEPLCYIFYVDVMTGEIIQEEPTIIA